MTTKKKPTGKSQKKKKPAGKDAPPAAKPSKQEKATAGRPLTYSREVADHICEQIAHGRSLASICKQDPGMPPASTFRRWVVYDVDGIAARSAHAYELGHDAIADQCLEIADEGPLPNPITGAIDSGSVQHMRLRIDTRLRLLGKWAPKKYGEKIDLNHNGKMTLEQLIAGRANGE